MTEAPKTPTTGILLDMHPLSETEVDAISSQRQNYAQAIRGEGFVAIVGGCSATEAQESLLADEGRELLELQEENSGLVTAQRLCVYKPRTDKASWHGEETTNPVGAHGLITRQGQRFASAAMEVAHRYHARRYMARLSFAWTGSRNVNNKNLIIDLALYDPNLPLGIKNGMDGEIEDALGLVYEINEARKRISDHSAPAVLIYRGGSNYTTPKQWEKQRQRAYELTGGSMLDDTAHGTSIAHDPSNQKGDQGQKAALEHLAELTTAGYGAAGIMVEASDVDSPTDPNLSPYIALAGIRQIFEAKNDRDSSGLLAVS